MLENLQNTNYQGAAITNEMAEALKRQPIGQELLRFEPKGNHTVMQIRLPEKGRYVPNPGVPGDPALEGVEFDIRINMNYLVRGMVRACMDQNGNVDPNKLDPLMDLTVKLSRGLPGDKTQAMQDFVNLLDIPAERRKEFEAFLRANHVGAVGEGSTLLHFNSSPISMMVNELETHMLPYQAAADGELGSEVRNHVAQYRKAFELTMQSYRDMASMDPETETRVLYPMDCIAFRDLTDEMIRQNNAYRKAHGLQEYAVEPVAISMLDQEKQAKQEGKHTLFATHAYLAADVEVELPDGHGDLQKENYTLSLETTAPAYGSLFHRENVVPTGVGVFPNKAAIEAYHRSQNIAPIKDFELYNAVVQHTPKRTGGKRLPILRDSQERTYRHYIDKHAGGVVNGLPKEKLEEYAAKVTAAAYLNKTAPEPFDLKRLHKYAEVVRKSPGFLAAMKTAGEKNLRAALETGRMSEVVHLTMGQKERYALSDNGRKRLTAMAAAMETEGRSTEWQALKNAMQDGNSKDSNLVFHAVEGYLKGKKKVRRDLKGQDAADLAISALAVVAEEGDAVAKQRAQLLVDRINQVRKVQPGDRFYVNLQDYPKGTAKEAVQRAGQQAVQQAEQKAPDKTGPVLPGPGPHK